jgi:hypothetical protein
MLGLFAAFTQLGAAGAVINGHERKPAMEDTAIDRVARCLI